MWCKGCHREVAAVPSAAGETRCPFCGELARTNLPVEGAAGTGQAAPSTQIFRTDSGHVQLSNPPRAALRSASSGSVQSPATDRRSSERQEVAADGLTSLAGKSWINLTGFFVVVFLTGQMLTIWAFLIGHFGAWALGQLFVGVGVTVTFWLMIRHTARLGDQQRQLIGRLNRMSRNLSDLKSRQRTRRILASRR